MAPVPVTTVMTWGLGAGSVPSISGPAAMTSWTLAPMPFSARGGAPPFGRPTPPIWKEKREKRTLVGALDTENCKNCPNS